MPSNAEIGDLVEIHSADGSSGFFVWPDSGSQIDFAGANNASGGNLTNRLYRLITAGTWVTVT